MTTVGVEGSASGPSGSDGTTSRVGATGVEVRRRLDEASLADVTALIDAATTADGVRPLNEHVMLHLRHGGDEPTRNLIARDDDGTVVGYAHLDITDTVAGPSAELVVHPLHRGQGHGRALVEQALRTADADAPRPAHSVRPRLRLWSHGSHRSARELASRMGFSTVRELWQMRRSLYSPIPDATFPPGVATRTFEPGRDEAAWLDLNARAFADHPEQGTWDADDLAQREAEDWFDQSGFFLAERRTGTPAGTPSVDTTPAGAPNAGTAATRLVGFHWTKVHGGHPSHDHDGVGPHEHSGHGHAPIGEVYVVGVDPDERGTGVGRALTVLGLCHLRARGLGEVMLYVDESNTAAIRLYESLGFNHWDTDVMYAYH